MSRPTAQHPAPGVPRRTALAGALAGLAALTGCEPGDGPGDPASAPAPEVGSDDPDAALVEAVLAEVEATSLVVSTLSRRHPSLRRALAELTRMHEAHREALGPGEPSGHSPPPTGDADEGLALLRRREQRHQRVLADHALSAESGRLARLLASMSAAVAQQLTALPDGSAR